MSSELTDSILTQRKGHQPSELEEIQCLEYITEKNRPIVCIWTRDPSGRRKEYRIPYRPYFFIADDQLNPEVVKTIKGVLDVKGGYQDWSGRPLSKVTVNLPANVAISRDALHRLGIKTWEADLKSFTLRWMVDHGILYTLPPTDGYPASELIPSRSVVLYIDIEVVGGEIVLLSYATDSSIYTIAVGEGESTNSVCYCASEKELLTKFKETFLRIDPDVIAGWNIHYDLRNLVARMSRHKLRPRDLSPIGRISREELGGITPEEEITIGGREVFDYARGYKELVKKELRVPMIEALDIVARRHLGFGKLNLGSSIESAWERDKQLVIAYNRRDVELLLLLEQKLGIYQFFNDIRRIVGVRLRDVWYKSRLADSGFLRLATFRLPTALENGTGEHYEGAYRRAEPGVYDGVLDIDFQSFYPTVIIEHNISPDTLNEDGTFRKDKVGLVPTLLKRWLSFKNNLKKQLKEAPELENKYRASKYMVNAVYGQMGYPKSRMYNLRCADRVTSIARQKIQELEQWFISRGYRVPYVDTDGLLVLVPKEQTAKLLEEANRMFEPFTIEEAHYFARVIIQAKTRYIGKTEGGEIVAKGMALLRADVPSYFSECQAKLCEAILEGASKEKVLEMVKFFIRNLRRVPLWDLGTSKGIKKPLDDYKVESYHISACKHSEQFLGLKFKVGDKPKIIPVTKQVKYIAIKQDTKLDPKLVDYNKLETLLLNTLKVIYTQLGITDEEVLGQLTLGDYLSNY